MTDDLSAFMATEIAKAARKWADDYDLAWTACDCEDYCPHDKAMARYKFGASESTMVRRLADALSALQARAEAAEARVKALEIRERAWINAWVKDGRDARYFSKAMTAQLRIEEAWDKALEAAANVADKWATEQQRQFGNGGPAAAIRALKSDPERG